MCLCVCDCQAVLDVIAKQAEYLSVYRGLYVYLDMCRRYVSVFTGQHTLYDKIRLLASVIFFIRLWTAWLTDHPVHNLANNGLTAPTRRNIEISAASVINLLVWCSEPEHGVTADVRVDMFGSDCVENYW
jgi:hypothetical protein